MWRMTRHDLWIQVNLTYTGVWIENFGKTSSNDVIKNDKNVPCDDRSKKRKDYDVCYLINQLYYKKNKQLKKK